MNPERTSKNPDFTRKERDSGSARPLQAAIAFSILDLPLSAECHFCPKAKSLSSGHNIYCVGTWLRRPNHQKIRIRGVRTSVIKSVTADALLIPPPYQ